MSAGRTGESQGSGECAGDEESEKVGGRGRLGHENLRQVWCGMGASILGGSGNGKLAKVWHIRMFLLVWMHLWEGIIA